MGEYVKGLVTITREVLPPPPIKKIEFKSMFGKPCEITKDDKDFNITLDGRSIILDRGTTEEVVRCLTLMLEGK